KLIKSSPDANLKHLVFSSKTVKTVQFIRNRTRMTLLMLKYNQYRILNRKGVIIMLKIQEIREIIRLIDESSISEFSYENEGSQVTIKKEANTVQVPQPEPEPVVQQNPVKEVSVSSDPQPSVKEEKPAVEEAVKDENTTEIVSPMVGTFYRKPSPDHDTYVELGYHVNNDSVVCIVEAMKLFNEIEADTSGEIVEVLVNDGDLVEYGQALFKVKTK